MINDYDGKRSIPSSKLVYIQHKLQYLDNHLRKLTKI